MVTALLVGGCQEPTTRIGSACEDGICPQRSGGQSGEACLFSTTTTLIAADHPSFDDVCIPSYLLDGDGNISCDVNITLPDVAASPASCAAAGYLPPGEKEITRCVVPQLSEEDRSTGNLLGWYGDSSSQCAGTGTPLRFTEGTVPAGALLQLICPQTLMADEEVGGSSGAAVDECSLPNPDAGDDGVGESCLPFAPENGFDDRSSYVMTGAGECASGACLVYRLRGDPSPDCVPRAPDAPSGDPGLVCVSGVDVEERVYCSCRCSAPEGDPGELCDCPDTFSCVEVMPDGPPGVRGGYCVRNGTFTE